MKFCKVRRCREDSVLTMIIKKEKFSYLFTWSCLFLLYTIQSMRAVVPVYVNLNTS